MSEFEYGWTCPKIYKVRDQLKTDILEVFENKFSHFMRESLYYGVLEEIEELINDSADEYRSINSDMRDAASEQIKDLRNERDDIQKDLQSKIDDLEDKIEELMELLYEQ